MTMSGDHDEHWPPALDGTRRDHPIKLLDRIVECLGIFVENETRSTIGMKAVANA